MPNFIFQALSKQKVDTFCSTFNSLSRELFYDCESHALRHSAEFGAYRERACADFLKLFLPTYLSVGTGFLINTKDEVSTQCDLIIFDPQYTPLVEDAERRRFFPVETVAAIGEVKSTLAKQELLDALIKLGRAKQLRIIGNDVTPVRRAPGLTYEPLGHHFDNMVSFLICAKLSCKLDGITAEISKAYELANIPIRFRHNLVLSLEDGVFCYKNHLLARDAGWMYPEVLKQQMKNRLIFPGENGRNHLGIFTAELFRLCASATIYLPQIWHYDVPQSMGRWQDEN